MVGLAWKLAIVLGVAWAFYGRTALARRVLRMVTPGSAGRLIGPRERAVLIALVAIGVVAWIVTAWTVAGPSGPPR